MEKLTWQSFKIHLLNNPQLALRFKYANDQWVADSYHITEIKQAFITSVDCGGVMNAWSEIVVQLWEPANKHQTEAMQVSKAISIIEPVENTLPLYPNGVVKVEFGNSKFDTRQMLPSSITVSGNNLIVELQADTVQCKAIERGSSCGTDTNGEECCTPSAKPKLSLKNLVTKSGENCLPGSGCC